jgi:hypothetical protein
MYRLAGIVHRGTSDAFKVSYTFDSGVPSSHTSITTAVAQRATMVCEIARDRLMAR